MSLNLVDVVQNARFGDLTHDYWRKSRTNGAWLLEAGSYGCHVTFGGVWYSGLVLIWRLDVGGGLIRKAWVGQFSNCLSLTLVLQLLPFGVVLLKVVASKPQLIARLLRGALRTGSRGGCDAVEINESPLLGRSNMRSA